VAEQRLAAGLRTIRIRSRLTQRELSIAARVPRSVIQALEGGRADRVRVGDLKAIASSLDASVDVVLRWHGGDLARLLNSRHAVLHELMASRFVALAAWTYEPEVSFSQFGERGSIDILAWHERSRSLLVIELKSELVDINDLMGSVDRKRRLAADVVASRGWRPASISTWVAVADTRTNRRVLARHERVLRAKFPSDGHRLRAWLRNPAGRLDALGFLSDASPTSPLPGMGGARLVRRARDPDPER